MSSNRLARWSRLAVFAAVPLMGAVLMIVVWWADRAIHSASETVIRGEAETLHAAVRARLTAPGDEHVPDRLAAVLDAGTANGLRYVIELDPDDQEIADAGQSSAGVDELVQFVRTTPPELPVRIGDRVRVWYGRSRTSPRPPRPPSTDPNHPTPGAVVIEIVPQVAGELQTTATWLLATGALAAVTLSLLAFVLVRWSLRREGAVRAMEQARHLATLGQMSAVLAHEIRNPLASLKGNAQLLAGALPTGEKVRAKADRVVEEATRLEMLSNDLLAFARAGDIRVADVDPASLLREAAGSVSPRIEIVADDAPRSWPLDPERIRQVLINLLENAVEISDAPVTAEVSKESSQLIFTVRDHGPGIAEADLAHLFEPFFTRRIRGTGLGLAVAKRLVELHHGTIVATNVADGGARFRITLPRP